jgi:hypothetical protein
MVSGCDLQCCVCTLGFDRKLVLALHLQMVHSMDEGIARQIANQVPSEK